MSQKRQCRHCRKHFSPRPQNPDQKYCSEPACQKARRRKWQRQKLRTDPEYRDNQRDAQRRWREKNPDYQREYRQRNVTYRQGNRRQQKERNRRNRLIVKMEASPPEKMLESGCYEIRPVEDGKIVKMDASIVEIRFVSGTYP